MAAGQAPVRPDKSLVPTARCPKVEQNTLASCNLKLHTKGFQSKSTQVSLFNKVPRRSCVFQSHGVHEHLAFLLHAQRSVSWPDPARREASSTVSTKHSSTKLFCFSLFHINQSPGIKQKQAIILPPLSRQAQNFQHVAGVVYLQRVVHGNPQAWNEPCLWSFLTPPRSSPALRNGSCFER